MSKLIFLDVDGTLVDYHNRIPESVVKAIRQAREKGHLVYVCTGRSKAEMQPELWEIGLDGMIGGNGSYVEHHGQVLMHQLISKEDAAKIVDWLTERHLAFYLESNNGLFASPDFRERARETLKTYAIQKGQSAESVEGKEPEDFIHGLQYGGELYRDDLNKVSFVLDSYQDHLDSKEVFPQLEAHTWGGRGETALFGDLGVRILTRPMPLMFFWNIWGLSVRIPLLLVMPRLISLCWNTVRLVLPWEMVAQKYWLWQT